MFVQEFQELTSKDIDSNFQSFQLHICWPPNLKPGWWKPGWCTLDRRLTSCEVLIGTDCASLDVENFPTVPPPRPTWSLYSAFPLLIKISACTEMVSCALRQGAPIYSDYWHLNTPLSFSTAPVSQVSLSLRQGADPAFGYNNSVELLSCLPKWLHHQQYMRGPISSHPEASFLYETVVGEKKGVLWKVTSQRDLIMNF